jgi:TolA-binding protein
MRVPVLFGDRFDLAARALLQAADHLLELNRTAEARIVLQEIVNQHAATSEADLATEKLKRLSNTSTNQRP